MHKMYIIPHVAAIAILTYVCINRFGSSAKSYKVINFTTEETVMTMDYS
jgi:hypothetical protein